MNALTNEPMDEMTRLSLAARDALTDGMVERLSTLGGNALELLDRINDPATGEAVHALIDRLTDLHKSGALETICELAMTLHSARNALTDSMVERLFMFAESMINTVGNEAMGELAENARLALEEAALESTRAAPPRGGMMAALSLLAKPETQRSLAFLLSFSTKLQGRASGPPARL
jgi:uncharacterized protein YjgD (DUF1641 family)